MNRNIPLWEKYERLVAEIIKNQLSTEYCVTPNASVTGVISGIKRQIDVLIDFRHDTNNRTRIIIDAKLKKRQIDVKEVETFLGLMNDVQATHGYLVCPNGYTKSAERRAQGSASLRLLPLDRLENFDPSTWPNCRSKSGCEGKIFWDGYPSIDLVLASIKADKTPVKTVYYIHYVGKCDKCRNFHVKCLTCGDVLTPMINNDDDIGCQCKCKMPWFWLASIESDDAGMQSAELHLVKAIEPLVSTVSRRTL
ncbi:MAG: restriction endonuclease [Alishewanella aestuarii]